MRGKTGQRLIKDHMENQAASLLCYLFLL